MSNKRKIKWFNVVGAATSSEYDAVESKFGQYLDLIDSTVSTLQSTKIDLQTATDLCTANTRYDESGNAIANVACDDAAELSTYVGELVTDVNTLTNEKALSEAFLSDVSDKIEGVTSESTTEQILAAIDLQLEGLGTQISEAGTAISNLEEEASTKADELEALENQIVLVLGGIEGDSEIDVSLQSIAVQTALGNLNDAVDGKTAELVGINETINSLETVVGGYIVAYEGIALGDTGNDLNALTAQIDALKDAMDAYYEAQAVGTAGDVSDAIDDALEVSEAAVSEATAAGDDALAAQLEDYEGQLSDAAISLSDKTAEFLAIEAELSGYETALDSAVTALIDSGDLDAGSTLDITDLTTQWSDALTAYNATAVELAASVSAGEALTSDKSALEAQVEGLQTDLVNKESVLQTANASIEEFNTLSTELTSEIDALEVSLSSMGYTVDGTTISGGFNGEEWSSFKGDGASDFKKLLFRGIKAKRAQSNIKADAKAKANFINNNKRTMAFNANTTSSKNSRLLRNTAMVLGAVWLGSMFLKK